MTSITLREHGYTLTLQGHVNLSEAQNLSFQMRDEWAGSEGPFVWVVDIRQFTAFDADAQAVFEDLFEEALAKELVRMTVLGVTTALSGLFLNIVMRADAMEVYQFLDVSYEKDFLAEMEHWLGAPFS